MDSTPDAATSIARDGPPVLLFDGVCNLCNGMVRFVVGREADPKLRFASLQSDFGRRLLKDRGLPQGYLQGLVLVEGGQTFLNSEAAVRVALYLRRPWRWFAVLRLAPSWLREPVYRIVARQRYRLFGKRDACPLPLPELRERFLG